MQRHNRLGEETIAWALFARIEADKFFSDIVESMLGTVYVDSKGDKSVCENMLERIGLLKYLRRIINEEPLKLINSKERVGHVADSEKVNYETNNSKEGWVCVLKIGGKKIVNAEQGTSRIKVETRAATLAVEKLGDRKIAKRKVSEKLESGASAEKAVM